MDQVLTFLGLIGVIVDPTTAGLGLGDSGRTMGYEVPWDDRASKRTGAGNAGMYVASAFGWQPFFIA